METCKACKNIAGNGVAESRKVEAKIKLNKLNCLQKEADVKLKVK